MLILNGHWISLFFSCIYIFGLIIWFFFFNCLVLHWINTDCLFKCWASLVFPGQTPLHLDILSFFGVHLCVQIVYGFTFLMFCWWFLYLCSWRVLIYKIFFPPCTVILVLFLDNTLKISWNYLHIFCLGDILYRIDTIPTSNVWWNYLAKPSVWSFLHQILFN